MHFPTRFVLLPTRGFTADEPHNTLATEAFLSTMAAPGAKLALASSVPRLQRFTVLDSIQSNGAKLVQMSDAALMYFKREHPGLRVVPERFYASARAPRPQVVVAARRSAARPAAVSPPIKVVLKGSGKPVLGVEVLAFTDWERREGDQATSNARGEVTLDLPRSVRVLPRLYAYPPHGAWPVLLKDWPLRAGVIELPPIDLGFVDARGKAYPERQLRDGEGVTVGVIDTGVGPHDDLAVAGGMNAVTREDPADWADVDAHGTHVAGIIGARGELFRGVAPGATLRAYRVFGKHADGASSFAIAKAIDRAVADGCDLLNLSLGGGPDDPTTSEAIKAARAKGVVCIIAAGNDGGPVAWPARHPLAVGVSALGFQGLWPEGATQAETVKPPLGKEHCFIADFSNTGPEIDLTGPGVGIVSCIPKGRYGVMDGTSMACPAVTGAVARRLAGDAALMSMARGADRADAIVRMALAAARNMGLPPLLQGVGLAR